MTQDRWVPDPETLREMIQDLNRQNQGMKITDAEAVNVLFLMAIGLEATYCPLRECENCERVNRLFWELSNGLPREYRVLYQAKLRDLDVPLPPSPVDEFPL